MTITVSGGGGRKNNQDTFIKLLNLVTFAKTSTKMPLVSLCACRILDCRKVGVKCTSVQKTMTMLEGNNIYAVFIWKFVSTLPWCFVQSFSFKTQERCKEVKIYQQGVLFLNVRVKLHII